MALALAPARVVWSLVTVSPGRDDARIYRSTVTVPLAYLMHACRARVHTRMREKKPTLLSPCRSVCVGVWHTYVDMECMQHGLLLLLPLPASVYFVWHCPQSTSPIATEIVRAINVVVVVYGDLPCVSTYSVKIEKHSTNSLSRVTLGKNYHYMRYRP